MNSICSQPWIAQETLIRKNTAHLKRLLIICYSEHNRRTIISGLKLHYRAIVAKNKEYWHKNRHIEQLERVHKQTHTAITICFYTKASKHTLGPNKVSHQVKVLTIKPYTLSSNPRYHIVLGQSQLF